jgi:hypothetical protein
MELAKGRRAELKTMVKSVDFPAIVETRTRIVLWCTEGRSKIEIATLAGVTRATVGIVKLLGGPA